MKPNLFKNGIVNHVLVLGSVKPKSLSRSQHIGLYGCIDPGSIFTQTTPGPSHIPEHLVTHVRFREGGGEAGGRGTEGHWGGVIDIHYMRHLEP